MQESLPCFVCRAPASPDTELPLDLLEQTVTHPLYRARGRAGLCRPHARLAAGHLFLGFPSRLTEVHAISVHDAHSTLRAAYPPLVRGGGVKATARRWKLRLLGSGIRCHCGAHATEIGHRIPRMAFQLCGLSDGDSYFEGNLDPVCRPCNVAWLDWLTPPSLWAHRFNGGTLAQRRIMRRRLTMALRVASDRGIPVGVPPVSPAVGWPGNPVFDTARVRPGSVLQPVAFVQDALQIAPRWLYTSEMRRPLRLIPDA